MSDVAFTLGPISVYWYSIFILVGAIIAFILISIESKSFDIPDNFVENLLFYGIIIGILGARIYYVAFEFDAYKNDIWGIFRIWEGGLAIHGGIIAGLLWIIYYCKKMRVKILRMLDIVVVGLILAQSIGRWGNYFNGEVYGQMIETGSAFARFPYAVLIDGVYYQALFLYECVLNLLGFLSNKWQMCFHNR